MKHSWLSFKKSIFFVVALLAGTSIQAGLIPSLLKIGNRPDGSARWLLVLSLVKKTAEQDRADLAAFQRFMTEQIGANSPLTFRTIVNFVSYRFSETDKAVINTIASHTPPAFQADIAQLKRQYPPLSFLAPITSLSQSPHVSLTPILQDGPELKDVLALTIASETEILIRSAPGTTHRTGFTNDLYHFDTVIVTSYSPAEVRTTFLDGSLASNPFVLISNLSPLVQAVDCAARTSNKSLTAFTASRLFDVNAASTDLTLTEPSKVALFGLARAVAPGSTEALETPYAQAARFVRSWLPACCLRRPKAS